MARTKANGINKMAAVREALTTLGKKAKPIAISQHLKEKHNISITPKVASSYKFKIAGPVRKKKRKVAAAQSESPTPKAKTHSSPTKNGYSLELLHTVKNLTDEVGAKNLKQLIDLLG